MNETKSYIDPAKVKLADLVKNNQKVRFAYYRDNEFWYEHESGFRFPVPIKDSVGVTLNAEDRAILFMRWMRNYIELAKIQI